MSLDEAIDAYERGEYERTRDLSLEAIGRGVPPQYCVLAHIYLGNALEKLGDQRGATEQFVKALSLDPSQDQRLHIHYKLGLGLRRMGDEEGARREFQSAIEQFTESAPNEVREQFVYALVELAHLEDERDDYSPALAWVERASQVSMPETPKNRLMFLHLNVLKGKALFWLNRWTESIPVLRRALAELPQTDNHVKAVVMCYLGLALCAVREFDEAFDVLQNTDLDPSEHPSLWASTRVWLGNLHYRRNEFAKALEQYEQVIDQPAQNWAGSRESLARMADCYLETGQPESALAVAEKAYRELRGNDLVHVEYAKALAVARRWREADQVLRELNEEAVDAGLKERFYAHSAYVAAGLQDRDGTERWLRKLRDLNPRSRYLPPLLGAIGEAPKRPTGFLR